MGDRTFQSVYFAYFFFVLISGGALYFFLRSVKHGYLGSKSEEPKYRMLNDALQDGTNQPTGAQAPRRP